MIDVKYPLRKSYYEVLNGNLLYNSVGVPVSDDLKKLQDSGLNVYVLLSTQSGSDTGTMQSFDSWENIDVDIIYKAARSSKQPVDMIAGQILGIILPAPGIDGLPRQTGIHISCVQLQRDQDIPAILGQTLMITRRVLTFRQRIRQTLDITPMPGLKKIFPVTSADFIDATEYVNPDLNGKTFQLFFNSVGRFIDFGVEWDYRPGGGAIIKIPDFNASLNIYEFYVLLN